MKTLTKITFLLLLISIISTVSYAQESSSRFSWGISMGMSAGGELTRIRENSTRRWMPPSNEPFNAYRFELTLHEGMAVSSFGEFKVTPRDCFRLSVFNSSYAVIALARQTDNAVVTKWDDVNVTGFGFSYRRVILSSSWRPYITAGPAYLMIDSIDPEMDQSILAATIGVGFEYDIARNVLLTFDLDDRIGSLDFAAYENLANDSAIIEENSPSNFFSFMVGMTIGL